MKKTYPGQSKKLVVYNIGTIVSILIVGSPTFLSSINRQVTYTQFIFNNTTLQPQFFVAKTYYNVPEGPINASVYALQATTLFKGYDQQTAGLF